VNSRLDIAMAARADGVHLTSAPGALKAEQVRELFPEAVVSISCHSVEEVSRIAGCGIDLILFGPVFGKVVDGAQVVAGVGLEVLRAACDIADGLPVLALGGITGERAAECVVAGAGGVAGIRLFAHR
jgi:thiamine-phosphate pyrophosphorylase